MKNIKRTARYAAAAMAALITLSCIGVTANAHYYTTEVISSFDKSQLRESTFYSDVTSPDGKQLIEFRYIYGENWSAFTNKSENFASFFLGVAVKFKDADGKEVYYPIRDSSGYLVSLRETISASKKYVVDTDPELVRVINGMIQAQERDPLLYQ